MEHQKAEFLRLNPFGEVPVLQHGDIVVHDPPNIISYLEEHFDTSKDVRNEGDEVVAKVKHFVDLFNSLAVDTITYGTAFHPQLSRDRSWPFRGPVLGFMRKMILERADMLEQSAELVPFAAKELKAKARKHRNRLRLFTDEDEFRQLIDRVSEVLEECELELKSHSVEKPVSWLCSNRFSEADCTLAVLMHRLELLGYKNVLWAGATRPNLSVYYRRVGDRKSFLRVVNYPSLFFSFAKKLLSPYRDKILSAIFVLTWASISSIVLYKRLRGFVKFVL